ncbi:hypothetical protein AXF42_Ash017221 [Apostasia shenzhenica]|uniref:Uncharacterized protein n=1 Tax=Apostasia shenzhenica TaxID=1088818 RepID=A0A2H9ZVI4_9ASPA|nr:hypothetical protein AXF42_Ash017221 [Apostasia shenzhenica]
MSTISGEADNNGRTEAWERRRLNKLGSSTKTGKKMDLYSNAIDQSVVFGSDCGASHNEHVCLELPGSLTGGGGRPRSVRALKN